MQYSKTGLQLTEQFEGFRATAYQDSGGVWTIGFGHTRGVYQGMTCTLLVAIQWLLEDVADAEAAVSRLVRVPLTQEEFDALVDFVFNLGIVDFMHSTLLGLLNAKNYAGAANEFVKWDRCGGVVLAGLLRRRQAEATEFSTT